MYVATVVAPLRKVKVILAEFGDSLDKVPHAATGVGLGPNRVLLAVPTV